MFPDFYDIYYTVDPDQGWRLYDTVPRGVTSFNIGGAVEDKLFFYIVSRLAPAAPPLVNFPGKGGRVKAAGVGENDRGEVGKQ